ncbi:DUF3107 domain-containing protein [Aeromicrobium sp. CF4.19]|uniref:DUF3107 domain-containing protein n=1 Tax=Aeromicrobium sp. CF4.19 TaxID=3373082 RepID=UPI003EE42FC4
MEVKIGVQNAARELSVDTDEAPDTVLEALQGALGDDRLFSLTDAKGRTVAVPADKVAYLYFTAEGGRKVGFGLGTSG